MWGLSPSQRVALGEGQIFRPPSPPLQFGLGVAEHYTLENVRRVRIVTSSDLGQEQVHDMRRTALQKCKITRMRRFENLTDFTWRE